MLKFMSNRNIAGDNTYLRPLGNATLEFDDMHTRDEIRS